MHKFRLFAFLSTIIFVIAGGLVVSYIARGYRFDTKNPGLKPTGILVVTSSPDGASIFVNGILETATNATINLPPQTYDIEVKKEGYLAWHKRLEIKKEEVTKVDTILFPAAPSLSSVTFSGAISPKLSPDGVKIVFASPDATKLGLWILDLGSFPIGFSSQTRQVTNINPQNASWIWSPDARSLLVVTPSATFVLNSGEMTMEGKLVNLTGTKLDKVLADWQIEETKKQEVELDNLNPQVQDIFKRKVEALSFSPDGKKIIYKVKDAVSLPEVLVTPLPGSSSQKQERALKMWQIYVYDIKEDRNFLISQTGNLLYQPQVSSWLDAKGKLAPDTWHLALGTPAVSWFPSSNHIVIAESNNISIVEYDGTNKQVVWSGPYEAPYAFPSPEGNRLLLLTKFGAGGSNVPNLYSLSLK